LGSIRIALLVCGPWRAEAFGEGGAGLTSAGGPFSARPAAAIVERWRKVLRFIGPS
jgi:hypothetical protein